mgnify:CR=1 FL=1
MSKVTVRVSVKGTDIREMMATAKEQVADLGDAPWTISEMELYGQDDMATKQGLVKMWSASMTLDADVNE